MAKRPILRGFVVGRQIVVFCPSCDGFHMHGWNSDDTAACITHRVAHCPPGGLFSDGGYYVSPFKQSDMADVGVKTGFKRRVRTFLG